MGGIGILGLGILLFSIVVHEYAHGWMALRCGDRTAQMMGRLTFNPIPHIDPVGTVVIPLVLFLSGSGMLFGWAKPVPVNPYNFGNPGLDNAKVSFAGPASNLILAVIFTVACIVVGGQNRLLFNVFNFGIYINLLLALFNMIPLAPLDGSHILEYYMPKHLQPAYHNFQRVGPIILLVLVMSGMFLGFSLLFAILGPPLNFLYSILWNVIITFS